MSSREERLVALLEQARHRGYFGPGPIAAQIAHARGYVTVAERVLLRPPARVVDLGTGGGLPGLILAEEWPAAEVTCIEAVRRRATDLQAAAAELFGDRVTVIGERAEVVAHAPEWRERADLVTARGLGKPALAAEIAMGLAAIGGWLLVSEPPRGNPGRWPRAPLAALGWGPARIETVEVGTFAALAKALPAPPTIPRSTRPLVKHPAW